ncbi:hypothetical protein [Marinobacterium mangrovicola]|uniref:hypothetical protein n=1 Tax=Marinobacterium mangrovicola TaxID=1476959 RepID=UPI001045B520|nr:hypothetical protein [Marinobacterium mangrovicola]
MEPLTTTFAKAVDDLSGNIFIPALICSVFVELGPFLHNKIGLNLVITYLIALLVGAALAPFILFLISEIGIRIFNGTFIGPYIGVAIMPLGFAGLFPDQFLGLNIPYTQVTGVAILAWSFRLVKGKRFFYGHFWNDV